MSLNHCLFGSDLRSCRKESKRTALAKFCSRTFEVRGTSENDEPCPGRSGARQWVQVLGASSAFKGRLVRLVTLASEQGSPMEPKFSRADDQVDGFVSDTEYGCKL